MTAKILDIGCGNRKRAGAIGIDINPRSDADVVHDLDQFPYPFQDSSFDEIYMDNVIEHLSNVIAVMEEIQRISRHGAMVKIIVPYFRAKWAFIDPTHRHFFTVDSFTYFDPDHIHNQMYRYSTATFKVERIVFNETLQTRFPTRMMKRIADRWPVRYENYLSTLWPLDDLTFYLRTIK